MVIFEKSVILKPAFIHQNYIEMIEKEEEVYKLVWLPKEKVINGLMNQASFWPEEWLLSMKIYWEKYER